MYIKIIQYSLLSLWILILSSAVASNEETLSPLPNQVTEKWSNFSLVGQTTLRRFGFHVYDSSFWVIGKKSGDIFNKNT